jgi:23S rRNA (uracil1939-C5)-methyltransferase
MARKKKAPEYFENVPVIDTGTEGQGICKIDNRVVFVPGVVPGDVIDLEIFRSRSKSAFGRVTRVVTPSEKRAVPQCEHFGSCGGCKWQNMQYHWQLHFKQKQVYDALTRIGGISLKAMDTRGAMENNNESALFYPILGSKEIYYYRNRLDYAFANKKWLPYDEMQKSKETGVDMFGPGLGFHVAGQFDKVLDIRKCHLQGEPTNLIRNEVRRFALQEGLSFFDIRNKIGLLRGLIIRTTSLGETMVIVMFGNQDSGEQEKVLKHIQTQFPEITSLLYVINEKGNDTIHDLEIRHWSGQEFVMEGMDDLKFRIGPKSFYQTNSAQAHVLYKTALDMAELTGSEIVYDLYTGAGTIANFISGKCKKVIGVDYIPGAIEDAISNSKLNGINNTSFFSGDMKKVLTHEFSETHGRPDVVISDPPRAGMDPEVCQRLLELEPEKIVYISCNPATQARDLVLLKEKYKVVTVQPVDMFPQTAHVENIVLLQLSTNTNAYELT